MLRNSSLFKPNILTRPDRYNDVYAKFFLCSLRGLTLEQANAELCDLQDMEMGLLCRFYDLGLRGDDIRNLGEKFSNFITLSSLLFYPDGESFDEAFMQALTTHIKAYDLSVHDVMQLLVIMAAQYSDELIRKFDALREMCIEAIKVLGRCAGHDRIILLHLMQTKDCTLEEASQKLQADRDSEVAEMRAIESPRHRNSTFN